MRTNAFFKVDDPHEQTIMGFEMNPGWWSRPYEYPWALDQAIGNRWVAADMGCGYTYRPFKDMLAQRYLDVYAVDGNPQMLTIMDQSPRNVNFVVADFTESVPAIPDHSVDHVFCLSVLEDLQSAKRVLGALLQFRRIMKDNGQVIITFDVPFDVSKPCAKYPGMYLDKFLHAAQAAGLFMRQEPDLDKEGALVDPYEYNLCVFHCVLEKGW